jgi:3-oxoacyl-[acyl-carrier protein] reductase
LVTGSNRGIGKETVFELARRGADIVVSCRSRGSSLRIGETVCEEIRKEYGRQAILVPADLLVRDEITHLFDEIKREFGRLDILVNNAAMARWKGLADPEERRSLERSLAEGKITEEQFHTELDKIELTVEDLDYSYQINTAAAYQCVRLAYPLMSQDSMIVNLSTFAAHVVRANAVDYVSVKRGLEGLSDGLAPDLKKYGIRIFAICPGFVDTRSLDMLKRDTMTRAWIEWTQEKYREDAVLDPKEVALFIANLYSKPMSETGRTYFVDNGVTQFLKDHGQDVEGVFIPTTIESS